MKFCRDHWSELRDAVESKGMGHLIKKTPEEAIENVKKDLAGTSDILDYDPLMTSYWMISGKALEMGGLYLMTAKEDGSEYCPLCELNKNAHEFGHDLDKPASSIWIQGCTDSVLSYCQENGLVPVRA